MDTLETLIDRIVDKEWEMFHNVNQGMPKAGCQENYSTFSAMRRSQFENWSQAACASYEEDLDTARREGRNLPAEKYIHMMARCTPEAYAPLAGSLPKISMERWELAQALNVRLLEQAAAMREKYPFLARIGRPLYSEGGDNVCDTSIETYQLGEFLTYSEKTLRLLAEHLETLARDGISLAEKIQLSALQAIGLPTFEAAEQAVMSRGQ